MLWVRRSSACLSRSGASSAVMLRINKQLKCSAIGPSTASGRNNSAPTINTVPSKIMPNIHESVRNVPGPSQVAFFRPSDAAIASGSDDGNEPAKQHDQARGDVPWHRVVAETLKARAVVGGGRGELVDDFRQSMAAWIESVERPQGVAANSAMPPRINSGCNKSVTAPASFRVSRSCAPGTRACGRPSCPPGTRRPR